MAEKARTTSRRAMLGGIAALSAAAAVAAPTIASPAAIATAQSLTDFDIAYRRYLELARADEYDSASGKLHAACEAYERENAQLVAEFGHRSAMPAAAKARWEESWARMKAAEQEHEDTFSEPRWQAACDPFAIPAPTMAAVFRKLEVAKGEDVVANDVIAFVEADLRRLAA